MHPVVEILGRQWIIFLMAGIVCLSQVRWMATKDGVKWAISEVPASRKYLRNVWLSYITHSQLVTHIYMPTLKILKNGILFLRNWTLHQRRIWTSSRDWCKLRISLFKISHCMFKKFSEYMFKKHVVHPSFTLELYGSMKFLNLSYRFQN